MANLTLVIDDDLLRRARIRALEQHTSVNELVRNYISAFAGDDDTIAARNDFASLARAATSGSGAGGRSWTRDDAYGLGSHGRSA